MKFEDYQKQAITFNIIEDPKYKPISYTLGLTGESGEVAEIIKKLIRNNDFDFSQINVDNLKEELGDILWYIAMLADTFDISLNDVAVTNIDKLTNRKNQGVIKGEGMNR
jgi:NTP pyrophosphatase (non-canonical NTP hydrolase)